MRNVTYRSHALLGPNAVASCDIFLMWLSLNRLKEMVVIHFNGYMVYLYSAKQAQEQKRQTLLVWRTSKTPNFCLSCFGTNDVIISDQ